MDVSRLHPVTSAFYTRGLRLHRDGLYEGDAQRAFLERRLHHARAAASPSATIRGNLCRLLESAARLLAVRHGAGGDELWYARVAAEVGAEPALARDLLWRYRIARMQFLWLGPATATTVSLSASDARRT